MVVVWRGKEVERLKAWTPFRSLLLKYRPEIRRPDVAIEGKEGRQLLRDNFSEGGLIGLTV